MAETGSGKTGAFAIPLIHQIIENNYDYTVLTLSPTRELATQTFEVFKALGQTSRMEAVSVIGGESMDKQIDKLSRPCQVIVGTPGRVNDLVRQKKIDLKSIRAVVFDEADRLFDMGFKKDIEFILSRIPKDRQLIMVSATGNQDVLQTAYKFHSHPKEIGDDQRDSVASDIDHKVAMISENEKFPYLVHTLRNFEDAYAIVFCNTQLMTHKIGHWLRDMNFKADSISGKLNQNKRSRLVQRFKDKEITILVCTDVAARGLDIKNVNLVINYDLPNEAANYIHRIGRTGRANEKGEAVSFCSYNDCEALDAIYEILGEKIEKLDIEDEHFAKDITKAPRIDFKTFKRIDHKNSSKPQSDKKRAEKKTTERAEIKKATRRPPKKIIGDTAPKAKEAEMQNTQKAAQSAPKDESNITFARRKDFTPSPNDKRFLLVTNKTKDAAITYAKKHFGQAENAHVNYQVLATKRKKYFIFGPKLVDVRLWVRPHYKNTLTPFLDKILELSGLNLQYKVIFKQKTLKVLFEGEDLGLLLRRHKELLNSFSTLIHQYLHRNVVVPKDVNLVVNVIQKREHKPRDNKRSRRPEESSAQ